MLSIAMLGPLHHDDTLLRVSLHNLPSTKCVQCMSVLCCSCRLLLALADVEQETSNWAQVIQLAQAASRAAQDAEVMSRR